MDPAERVDVVCPTSVRDGPSRPSFPTALSPSRPTSSDMDGGESHIWGLDRRYRSTPTESG